MCQSHLTAVMLKDFRKASLLAQSQHCRMGELALKSRPASKNWLLSLPASLIKAYGCCQRSCSLCSAPSACILLSAGDAPPIPQLMWLAQLPRGQLIWCAPPSSQGETPTSQKGNTKPHRCLAPGSLDPHWQKSKLQWFGSLCRHRHLGHDTGQCGLNIPLLPTTALGIATITRFHQDTRPLTACHSSSRAGLGPGEQLQNNHSHPDTPLKESRVTAFPYHCCYKCFKEKRKPDRSQAFKLFIKLNHAFNYGKTQ